MSDEQTNEGIQAFLEGLPFAVVGASTKREKYGNKVLRCYQQNNLLAWPINPVAEEIEGVKAFPSILDLPEKPHGVSIITPPSVTEKVVSQAVEMGVKHLWMQPGAESDIAISTAVEAGINVIANGPCLLVVLGYRES